MLSFTITSSFYLVITFPGSYHFGFNTGFNVAESTNFAVPEWVSLGEEARICMCHPHSVRIQMTRLKSLLDSYEKDMCYRESMGLPKLTYSNWAKHEAKRLKQKSRTKCVVSGENSVLNKLKLPTAINSSITVEITKESVTPKKKKGKKTLRRQERNEWRLAKKGRPSLFVPRTQVICMIECEDADDSLSNDDFEFFIGTIVKVVDEYVKVHLIGLGKKDDIWFERDSCHLFIDGGLTTPPSLNEVFC